MDYRTRIYALGLSRKVLAARLGLTYQQLSSRLAGFTGWQQGEERALVTILEETEQARMALETDRSERQAAYYAR